MHPPPLSCLNLCPPPSVLLGSMPAPLPLAALLCRAMPGARSMGGGQALLCHNNMLLTRPQNLLLIWGKLSASEFRKSGWNFSVVCLCYDNRCLACFVFLRKRRCTCSLAQTWKQRQLCRNQFAETSSDKADNLDKVVSSKSKKLLLIKPIMLIKLRLPIARNWAVGNNLLFIPVSELATLQGRKIPAIPHKSGLFR